MKRTHAQIRTQVGRGKEKCGIVPKGEGRGGEEDIQTGKRNRAALRCHCERLSYAQVGTHTHAHAHEREREREGVGGRSTETQ